MEPSLKLTAINPGAFSGTNALTHAQAKRLVSYNPATEEKLGEVLTVDETAYETIVSRAQDAFLVWREVPAPKRGELIYEIGRRLRQMKPVLGELVSLESGKSLQEGLGEVQEMIDMADFAVGQSRMLYGKTMHSERPLHRMYEQWHPYGVIGVISAFNFPVAVWAWNAFIAAICGNSVVWKPSAKVPLCAIAVHQICAEVCNVQGCPDIFSLFIPESHAVANKMLTDTRLPLISFTGSTQVGKTVASTVGARLGRTLLELGGNNAMIVDETADFALALPAIVFGAVGTAGQRCTTTRRLFVQDNIYQQVVDSLTHAYSKLKIGSPLDKENHMGPLIDADAVKQFESAMVAVKKQGGVIRFGGKKIDRPGFYVEPTIVTDVQNDWEVVQTETFAPILYVMPYHAIEEAIASQNAVPQGLSSAFFTQNLLSAERFLSAMGSDCGIANINIGTSGAEIGGAFGGEKETGGGREAGSDAWQAYMRRQTNTINWGQALPLAQGIHFEV